MSNPKHILVLGGGQAGVTAAIELSMHDTAKNPLRITLVDPKDYFELRWASIRAMINEHVRNDFIIPYQDLLPPRGIIHLQSKVTVLNIRNAILESGDTIQYDIALIAVGASHPMPGVDPKTLSLPLRKEELVAAGKHYLSNDLLIIGGGLLGAEAAGEFAGHANQITLVQNSSHLVPEMCLNARLRSENVLKRLGVRVITGQRAEIRNDGKYQVGDEVIETAVPVKCTGYYPRNDFLKKGDIPQDCIDKHGWIKTNKHFQVIGCENVIYALGDCCDAGPNVVQTILANYKIVVANMMCSLNSDVVDTTKLKIYRAPLPIVILTLGPKHGVAETPFGVFERIIPGIKNWRLFIGYGKSYVVPRNDKVLLTAAVGGVAAFGVTMGIRMLRRE